MAKKYIVKNITVTPARPIILMCCACGGALGLKGNAKMVSTNADGVTLTEAQYKHCKGALDRYEAADMVAVKEVEGELTADEKAAQVKSDKENKEAADKARIDGKREEAKSLKIKGYHLMGEEKLDAAIAGKDDKEDQED
jgi:hypothetical protein